MILETKYMINKHMKRKIVIYVYKYNSWFE